MNASFRPVLSSCILLTAVACGVTHCHSSEPAPPAVALPDDVREALVRSADRLRSADLEWTETDVRPASMQWEQLLRAVEGPNDSDVVLKLRGPCSYSSQRSRAASNGALRETLICGGVVTGGVSDAERARMVTVDTIDRLESLSPLGSKKELLSTQYLDIAGFNVPKSCADIRAERVLQSVILSLLDHCILKEDARQVVDGVECRVFLLTDASAQIRYRCALDPARDYCLIALDELTLSGQLEVRHQCGQYVLHEGVWLPGVCAKVEFIGRGAAVSETPLACRVYRLKSFAPGTAPLSLSTDYLKIPGVFVRDSTSQAAQATSKGVEEYRVPATRESLERTLLGLPARRTGLISVLVLLNAVLIGAGLLVWARRRT